MTNIPARLAAATGPDREIDWLIWFETATEPADHSKDNWPAYTASIDATIALVDLMRGDRPAEWSHSIMQTAVEMAWRRFVDDGGTWAAWLPITLLRALFAALAKPGPGAVG